MVIIVNEETKAVAEIAVTAQEVEHGILVNEEQPHAVMYSPADMYTIVNIDAVPDYVTPYKYCYDETKGFYENPDFVPYVDPEERVKQLEAELAATKTQMATLASAVDFLMGV